MDDFEKKKANIGEIIRFHRKRSRLSQMELAQRAGVGKTVIFDIEKGKKSVQLDTLQKIITTLNISMEFSSGLMTEYEKAMQTIEGSIQKSAKEKTTELTVAALLKKPSGTVHLAGICGIGMAGVAALLKARGFEVTGCDVSPNTLVPWLETRGIKVFSGHDPSHISQDVGWVIYSPALSEQSPELQAVRLKKLPLFRRGEVLPALLSKHTSIAVAGTHGKTTTSSLIAQILKQAGRDPSFCIGGEIRALGGVAGTGQGEDMVVEADESDGTLALYAPTIAVITNIEFDHMEHFTSIEEFEGCFRKFASQARRVIYGLDDSRAAKIGRECGSRGLSFGFSSAADIHAVPLDNTDSRQHFRLVVKGGDWGEIILPMPGRHNILNALAAAAVGVERGLTFEQIRDGLMQVELPRRRFDRMVDRPDLTVISDYAHHPSEVAALLQAAQTTFRGAPLRVVFQPHRYTRTRALGADFPPAFAGASEIILLPVYAASEPPLVGGTHWDLYQLFRAAEPAPTRVASSLEHVWDYWCRTVKAGECLLVVGAGDVEKIGFRAQQEWANRPIDTVNPVHAWWREVQSLPWKDTVVRSNEPLAHRTTLGVGGAADLWVEIGEDAEVIQLLQWTAAARIPFHLLGGGSNLLINDLGVRGVVGRLTGSAFRRVEWDGELLLAGAGVPLARLIDAAQAQGLAGLEFLEGIPGTVGGALHMNAGAWGQALGERVEWVDGYHRNGTPCRVTRAELHGGYRCCHGLDGVVVTGAAFRLARGEPDSLRQTRKEISERRCWMKGLRSAGSVFKNPPDDYAGRLIEAAGLKGLTIGGARILERHANIIVTEPGARAADVEALMVKTRIDVETHFGVKLAPEIEQWN